MRCIIKHTSNELILYKLFKCYLIFFIFIIKTWHKFGYDNVKITLNKRSVGMKSKIKIFVVVILAGIVFYGCGSTREVSRIDSDQVVDLSGRWNDTDSRLVAEEMVTDALNRVWLTEFLESEGAKPVVIVGDVRNKSSEHIPVDIFIKDIERELINSGKVKFVATSEERKQIREERMDQKEYSSDETYKRFYREIGADYMLIGVINSIEDAYEGDKVIYFQVDLELIDIETNQKVWIGNKKIKKLIGQSSYSM